MSLKARPLAKPRSEQRRTRSFAEQAALLGTNKASPMDVLGSLTESPRTTALGTR